MVRKAGEKISYSPSGRRREMRNNPTNFLARANMGGYRKAIRDAKNKKVQEKSAVEQTKIEDYRAKDGRVIDKDTQRDSDGYFADNKDVLKNFEKGKITKSAGKSKPIPTKKSLLNKKSKEKTKVKTDKFTGVETEVKNEDKTKDKTKVDPRKLSYKDRMKFLAKRKKEKRDSEIKKTYEALKKKGGKIKDSLLKKIRNIKTRNKQKEDTKDNTGDTTNKKTSSLNESQKERIAKQKEKLRKAKAASLLKNRNAGLTRGSSILEKNYKPADISPYVSGYARTIKSPQRAVDNSSRRLIEKQASGRVAIDDPRRRRLKK